MLFILILQFKNMHSKRAKRLVAFLEKISPVAVALSGGLDSCVVAKAARLASKGSLAVTIDDFTVPRGDVGDAKRVAQIAGIRHIIVKSSPSKKVLENPKNRCFYCKSHNYKIVRKTAKRFGIAAVVDGANADDTKEYRPGMAAAKKMGVRSPLLELGIGKTETRALAKEFGLSVWDKPSSACLSSRIPHGKRITKGKLARIELAESAIRELTQIAKVRVRAHEGIARIEVPKEELPRLFDKDLIVRIAKKLRKLGFSRVALDLEGYRPGGA
jgi:uncharacterized protein